MGGHSLTAKIVYTKITLSFYLRLTKNKSEDRLELLAARTCRARNVMMTFSKAAFVLPFC